MFKTNKMKKSNLLMSIGILLFTTLFIGCNSNQKKNSKTATVEKAVVKVADENLPDWKYTGYRVVHHMTIEVNQIKDMGFNKFENSPIADYKSFVITPALDHFYTRAIVDLRNGPVIVNTPARDDRYSSLEVFDMEHHSIFAEVTGPKAQRYVIVHKDYKGNLPEGKAVIRTNSLFPFIFIRTQTFDIKGDKKSDKIRRQASIEGTVSDIELPDVKDTQALIQWVIDNSNPYPQTKDLMAKAATSYTPEVHKETFENLKGFLASGGVSGNVGMFESVDDPDGGSQKVRAAGTLLGHLGFPVYHAYYQQIPMNRKGERLTGKNGPFVVTLPYKPGVEKFWSVTRYGSNTFLPLNPADIGGNNIQAYNAFNTKPDTNGNVTFTFSMENPNDGTYWIPVKKDGYYFVVRYYGPTSKMNGQTAKDIIYKGTPLEKRFESVKF